MGLLRPLLGADAEVVESGLAFNPVEFDRIKIGIEDLFPSSQELHSVPVTEPIMEEEVPILGPHHIRASSGSDSERSKQL